MSETRINIIIGILAWGVLYVLNNTLDTPSISYEINYDRNNCKITGELRNLSRNTLYKTVKFSLTSRDRLPGIFSEYNIIGIPPAFKGEKTKLVPEPGDTSISVTIENFYPKEIYIFKTKLINNTGCKSLKEPDLLLVDSDKSVHMRRWGLISFSAWHRIKIILFLLLGVVIFSALYKRSKP